jgi:hypothetical protein
LAALARRIAFQLEIPMCTIHRHCSSASSRHAFSFDGADDKAILDLLDLSLHHFPNCEHDRYLQVVPTFDIPGIDMFDLAQVRNQQALAEECIFLAQNLRGFQLLDRLQIFAMCHLPLIFLQQMLESHHIQQVVLDFPLIPTMLEDPQQR